MIFEQLIFTTAPVLIGLNEFDATLREKCPNMELYLVGIFPHSD